MNLREAITIKQDEIQKRKVDLKITGYEGKDWAQWEIDYLTEEIKAIRFHTEEDGDLRLPHCKYFPSSFCLLAHVGFEHCWIDPEICSFLYQLKFKQKELL